VLFMPASNIQDFGFGNIESHNLCTPSSRTIVCLYAGSADENGGRPQCVVTFGFEHVMQTSAVNARAHAVRAS